MVAPEPYRGRAGPTRSPNQFVAFLHGRPAVTTAGGSPPRRRPSGQTFRRCSRKICANHPVEPAPRKPPADSPVSDRPVRPRSINARPRVGAPDRFPNELERLGLLPARLAPPVRPARGVALRWAAKSGCRAPRASRPVVGRRFGALAQPAGGEHAGRRGSRPVVATGSARGSRRLLGTARRRRTRKSAPRSPERNPGVPPHAGPRPRPPRPGSVGVALDGLRAAPGTTAARDVPVATGAALAAATTPPRLRVVSGCAASTRSPRRPPARRQKARTRTNRDGARKDIVAPRNRGQKPEPCAGSPRDAAPGRGMPRHSPIARTGSADRVSPRWIATSRRRSGAQAAPDCGAKRCSKDAKAARSYVCAARCGVPRPPAVLSASHAGITSSGRGIGGQPAASPDEATRATPPQPSGGRTDRAPPKGGKRCRGG